MVMLVATRCRMFFFAHVFRNMDACTVARVARTWPLSLALRSLQSELHEETPEERQAILDALSSRDASLNRKRLQPLIEKRPCGHAPVCTIDSFKNSSSASIELQVAGVRRWLRGPTWRQLHYARPALHTR